MDRFIWLLMISAALYCGSASAEKEVQLMVSISPPYSDNKLPEQGLALQLVKVIFAGTEYAPKVTIENWSRALEGVGLGVGAIQRRRLVGLAETVRSAAASQIAAARSRGGFIDQGAGVADADATKTSKCRVAGRAVGVRVAARACAFRPCAPAAG